MKDVSPNGSITAPGDDIVLSFEQDITEGGDLDAPVNVDFGANCPANPTTASQCAYQLGSATLTCTAGACTATYTVSPALGVGVYKIIGFTTMPQISNSIVHAVETSEPVASEITLSVPASTPFGSPVELMPSVDPFPLTGTAGAMGTFRVFASSNDAQLAEGYVVPTGFDGRGTVASPGLGVAFDVGSTNVYAKYVSPSSSFPTASSGNSGPIAAIVVAAPTTVTVSASDDFIGAPVTLTANLAAAVTVDGFPAGMTFSGTAGANATLTFYSDGNPIGAGTLVAGSGVAGAPKYTLTTSAVSDASHDITATYSGNTRFITSTSDAVTIVPQTPDTTLTVTPSKSTTHVGEPVSFTASISTTAGSPTGTVSFRDTTNGDLELGTTNVVAGAGAGTAVITVPFANAGNHTILAVYNGDAAHPHGASATTTETVTKAVPTMTFTASSLSIVYGQSLTLSANVSVSGTSPNGTLKVFDGGILVASKLGTTAFATVSTLPIGMHSLRATYTDDPNVEDISADLTESVGQATSAVAVSASTETSGAGGPVTFTAVVTALAPGAATPTGTVTFLDGSTQIGTGAIGAGGVATFETPALSVGAHTITASYSGDTHLTAGSGSVAHRVSSVASSLHVSASPTTGSFGSAIVLKAKPDGTVGVSTGTVSYHIGTTQLGTAGFDSSGYATLSTTALPVGASTITADFSGDSTLPASSGSVTVVISTAATTTTVASSANPAVQGATVTFTATVQSTGAQPAPGEVVFFDGSVAIGTATLTNGNATLAVSSLGNGAHSIIATYQGSVDFSASRSDALSETIGASSNGPPSTTTAPDAGATKATTTTANASSSDDGGCSQAPASPTSSFGVAFGTVLALSALRRRKRAA